MTLKNITYIVWLLFAGCLASCNNDSPVPEPEPELPPEVVLKAVVAGITVNATGFCPLSAQIRVNTTAGMSIRATVLPKAGAITPAQSHTFPYSTGASQFIDVLGLYADYTNRLELAFLDAEGVQQGDTLLEIPVAPMDLSVLPRTFRVLTADAVRMEPGMNLVIYTPNGDNGMSVPYMVDADGEIRWLLDWRTSPVLNRTIINAAFSRMSDGNWITGDRETGVLQIVSPLGESVRTIDLTQDYKFHHDVMQMTNGHLLACMDRQGALRADGVTSRIRDHIVEIDLEAGTVVRWWDLAAVIDSARVGRDILGVVPAGQSATNWAHNNAIADWGDDYIASMRYQGIVKFDKQGMPYWIIAPHRGWRESYRPYLLTPLHRNGTVITDPAVVEGTACTDDFDWIWGVHAPVILPDNGTLRRVLCYDNGLARHFIRNNQQIPYSRAVIYEIDETNMTIRQVWDYGKDMPQYYTAQKSNAAYLPQTGHVLFAPSEGVTLSDGGTGCCLIELDPDTNEKIFELEIVDYGFHRVYRLPLYFN
ncbi:MAG: aryl-sulfate sulfotransferase [Mediterranea sp.]|jgi:arylsulfate sulfotransferase|nr:aryl-sulfate sulfotransferase [Mediterranea sp.]